MALCYVPYVPYQDRTRLKILYRTEGTISKWRHWFSLILLQFYICSISFYWNLSCEMLNIVELIVNDYFFRSVMAPFCTWPLGCSNMIQLGLDRPLFVCSRNNDRRRMAPSQMSRRNQSWLAEILIVISVNWLTTLVTKFSHWHLRLMLLRFVLESITLVQIKGR